MCCCAIPREWGSLSGMAKKKPKPMQTTQDRHTTPRVVFHLQEELLSLIDSEAEANDRTRTAEIVRALKAHYQAQGKWPVKQGGE
jgi:hypothetical protein